MIIDTIISSLIADVQSAGYEATTSPIGLFIRSNQTINEIVSIAESYTDLEPFEAHINLVANSEIVVSISVKTNDNDISMEKINKIRDDVVDVIRNYDNYQIIINRMTRENKETGSVVISIYCSVKYTIS